MSGPKVVRVVTREEIEAICRHQIRLFEAAAGELRRTAKRHDAYDAALESDLERRRTSLQQLLSEGRLADLQRQAPQETAFLHAERERVRADAIAAAEAARTKGRRLTDAARSLLAVLEASGQNVPDDLRKIASGRALTETEFRHVQGVLNEAFKKIVPPAPSGPTAAQQDFAGRLAAGTTAQSLGEWLVSRTTPTNPNDVRLDRLLAEIEILTDPDEAQAFVNRAGGIAAEPSPERQALLTDSLILDVSAHIRHTREREQAETKLREALAALAAVDSSRAHDLETKVKAALASKSMSNWEDLLRQSSELVEVENRALAAASRRQAVLNGLAALGYEVRETMATAWAHDGRIVVRKPGMSDYGVELGAPADVARLQVRLVGSATPATPRNAQRDHDQETIWCSEFDRLRAMMAQGNTAIEVERAIEAGAQAVKTVHFGQPDAAERRDVERPMTPRRGLRRE